MRVVLIEDRPSMREALSTRLERIGGTQITWAPHFKFADARRSRAANEAPRRLFARADLVLMDAYDRDQIQDHPTRSPFRCLDAVTVLKEVPDDARPTIIGYSTAIERPEVHLTLHCTGVVAARYAPGPLLDNLERILAGAYPDSVPPPVPDDWKRVHPAVRPGADLARLHQCMEANERAWQVVVHPDAPFDQAAQKWISREVLPWLTDADHPSYRTAIDVTRRIAGLTRV